MPRFILLTPFITLLVLCWQPLKLSANQGGGIDSYLPLREGYAWRYKEIEYDGELAFSRIIFHKIMLSKTGNEDEMIFSTNRAGLFPIYDENEMPRTGAIMVRNTEGTGITITTKNHEPVYPSRLYYLLKLPLKKGNSWVNRTSFLDIIGQRFVISSTDAAVELKNGLTFHNCIEVTSEYISGFSAYIGKQWYAPGIGLVKSMQWKKRGRKRLLMHELELLEMPELVGREQFR